MMENNRKRQRNYRFTRTRLRPSKIRYSQDSIKTTFYNHNDETYTLEETLRDLLDGSITPDTLHPIKILYKDDFPFAIDGNRRLFLYKLLEQEGIYTESVPVNVFPSQAAIDFEGKFTTKNNGTSVKLRGYKANDYNLRYMIALHKQKKAERNSYGDGFGSYRYSFADTARYREPSPPSRQSYPAPVYRPQPIPSQQSFNSRQSTGGNANDTSTGGGLFGRIYNYVVEKMGSLFS